MEIYFIVAYIFLLYFLAIAIYVCFLAIALLYFLAIAIFLLIAILYFPVAYMLMLK